jgi:hypothetical protein
LKEGLFDERLTFSKIFFIKVVFPLPKSPVNKKLIVSLNFMISKNSDPTFSMVLSENSKMI